MNNEIKKVLEDAEKRLDEFLPDIEKRHRKAVEDSSDEPENLKEGAVDDLEIPRAIKEQKDEKLSKK